MARVLAAVPVLILALFVQDGMAVRCWTCSSDLDPTCNDPFNAAEPYNTNRYTLTNCDANAGSNFPYLHSSKSVCKKQKQYVNGELTIIRGCTWKRSDDYSATCPVQGTPSYIRTTFCETCETDGCNGASPLTKSLILTAVPVLLLALFK